MLNALLIRCRSCTPASTVELTGWLEGKVAQLSNANPPAAVRLTRLVQDLPTATLDDGWLIEIQRAGEGSDGCPDSLAASLEEVLSDMRILGLDPVLLVPGRLPATESALAVAAGAGRACAGPGPVSGRARQ